MPEDNIKEKEKKSRSSIIDDWMIIIPLSLIIIFTFIILLITNTRSEHPQLIPFMEPDIQKCLHVKTEGALSSGSRVTFNLSCYDEVFDLEDYDVEIHYSFDNKVFDSRTMLDEDSELKVTIPTMLGDNDLYYYFTLDNYTGDERYPKEQIFYLELSSSDISIQESDIEHEKIEYIDLLKGSKLITLSIKDDIPIGDVTLSYKFNDDKEYINSQMGFDEMYTDNIEIPELTNRIIYYFTIETLDGDLIYPKDGNFMVQDPMILTSVKEELLSYASSNKLTMQLAFDDLNGNNIYINEQETVNGLSTIKLFIMVEVYRQLEEGNIDKSDIVSRYGYTGTIDKALRQMMVYSNNEASGALILAVGGTDNINATLKGYLTDVNSLISHTPAYSEGGYNYVSVVDQVKLLGLINKGEILTRYKQEILELLASCADYFSLKNIEGIDRIMMKTGYYPYTQYGLVAIVETDLDVSYILALHVKNTNNRDPDQMYIKDIVGIIQKYYE